MKIVTITGGTGGLYLLKGLSKTDYGITSIFSPFDSGGSAGLIRDEFGGIAWGDIRRGLLALSPDKEPYTSLKKLVEHRFDKNSSLKGHNFGNLILLSLSQEGKSDENGLKMAETLFGLPEGRHVIPSTFQKGKFMMELSDGKTIEGGKDISKELKDARVIRVYTEPKTKASENAIESIKAADVIIVGPGSFYNSLIPSFIVEGITESLRKSKAKIIYICNSFSEVNQTDKMKASDFVRNISEYIGRTPDYSIFNTKKTDGKRRTEAHKNFIELDRKDLEKLNTKVIEADLVDEEYADRYSPDKLLKALKPLIGQ